MSGVLRSLLAVVLSAGTPLATAPAPPTRTVLVSVSRTGGEGNHASAEPALSGDGRYVAFTSHSTNLLPGDTNNRMDVFVRDLVTGTTRRASLGSDGVQSNLRSHQPAISAHGRYVAFVSEADNLVAGDTNGQPDVFVRDMRTGTTRRVSVRTDGSQGNGGGAAPAISADGRYVAFVSDASDLVAGDTNGTSDAFVHDTVTGTTERVSVGPGGRQADGYADAPDISADGRYVSLVSPATSLVPGDTNGLPDVFVRDRVAGTTRRASVGAGGAQADGANVQAAISADGRHVVFVSEADNLVPTDTDTAADVLVRDLVAGTTRQVSFRTDTRPGSYAAEPDISATGRFIAFVTPSPLLPGEPDGTVDVYLRDTVTGVTRRQSVATDGTPADLSSADPSISADGSGLAFTSAATNLAPGGANRFDDIFARHASTG
jgi:TolB protein